MQFSFRRSNSSQWKPDTLFITKVIHRTYVSSPSAPIAIWHRWTHSSCASTPCKVSSVEPRLALRPFRGKSGQGARALADTVWHNVDEVAAHLQVKRETIYVWIAERHMPAHRAGRRWRFDLAEVDSSVRSGKGADWTTGGKAEKK